MKKILILFLFIIATIVNGEHKYSLITFVDMEPPNERSLEFIEALENNLQNPLIDEIYILYNSMGLNQESIFFNYLKQRPVTTLVQKGMAYFSDAFNLADQLAKNDRIIIANPDIYFNTSLSVLNNYRLDHAFLGITAYWNGELLLDKQVTNAPEGILQHTWIFEKPFYVPTNNIPIGTIYSGALISYQVFKAGFSLFNPSLSIIATKISKKDNPIYWKHPEQDMLHPIPFSKLADMKHDQEQLKCSPGYIIPEITTTLFFPFIQAKDKKNKILINPFLFILHKNFPNHEFIEINYSPKTQARLPFKKNHLIENKNDFLIFLENSIASEQDYIFFLNQLCDKKDKNYTPYLHELKIIQEAQLHTPVIIISGAHLFYSNHSEINHAFNNYPTITQLMDAIKSIDKNYRMACIDDLFICYASDTVGVSAVTHACTVSRLFDTDQTLFSVTDVIQSEKIIANALRVEKDAIELLSENYNEPWSKRLGMGQHYLLWYGLILLEQRDYKKAYQLLKEAYDRGLNHWRIKWYLDRAYCGMGTT